MSDLGKILEVMWKKRSETNREKNAKKRKSFEGENVRLLSDIKYYWKYWF